MNVTNHFQNAPEEISLTLTGSTDGVSRPASVVLNSEHELKLYRGNTLLHTFVCSPSDLDALCAGWLLSEGYAADDVEIASDGHTAMVYGAPNSPTEPQKLSLRHTVHASTDEMLARFREASDLYSRSHGIHECVIKGEDWYIIRTDIGRHNAIDKAVGAAVLAGYELRGAVLFTSGRINLQTVRKAVRCGIGCLMSKAVITHDALILAGELGLNVLFSVKESGFLTK